MNLPKHLTICIALILALSLTACDGVKPDPTEDLQDKIEADAVKHFELKANPVDKKAVTISARWGNTGPS